MTVETFKAFRDYNFGQSKIYESTLNQVLEQYLVVLSERELAIKEDISRGVLDPSRISATDRAQLELQTKSFVFCQETENILELASYQEWVALGCPEEDSSRSYDEVVDMIVNNEPVPGIKEIPDTVLDPKDSSEQKLDARKKPWE